MLPCPSFLPIMPTSLSAAWRTMLPTLKVKQQPRPCSQTSTLRDKTNLSPLELFQSHVFCYSIRNGSKMQQWQNDFKKKLKVTFSLRKKRKKKKTLRKTGTFGNNSAAAHFPWMVSTPPLPFPPVQLACLGYCCSCKFS